MKKLLKWEDLSQEAQNIVLTWENDRKLHDNFKRQTKEWLAEQLTDYTSWFYVFSREAYKGTPTFRKQDLSQAFFWLLFSITELPNDIVLNFDNLPKHLVDSLFLEKAKIGPTIPVEPVPTKEKTMSNITTPDNIQTKVFVNAKDIEMYTDDELYALISKNEAEVARLSAIKNKPKKLEARIAEITAGITKLVEAIDAR